MTDQAKQAFFGSPIGKLAPESGDTGIRSGSQADEFGAPIGKLDAGMSQEDIAHANNPTMRDVLGGVLENAVPLTKMSQSPFNQAIGSLTGLGQAAKLIPTDPMAIAQLPGNVAQTAGRLLTGQSAMPKDVDPYEAVGTKSMPINTLTGLVQAGSGFLLPYGGAKGFLSRVLKPVNLEKAALKIQGHHNRLLEGFNRRFEKQLTDMEGRGVKFGGSPLTTTKSGAIQGILDRMEEAGGAAAKAKGLPQIKEAAAKGNYKPLQDYQSALGKIERRHYRNPDNYHLGEQIHEERNNLFKWMEDTLRKEGHDDLADNLVKNREDYAKFKEIFYPRKEHSIIKLNDPNTQELSSATMNVFKKRNKYTRAIMNEVPDVKADLNRAHVQESLKNAHMLNKLKVLQKALGIKGLIYGGGSPMAAYGLYQIYKKLTGGGDDYTTPYRGSE